MTPPPPTTVALAGFDDLLTLGLRALLADDPALAVVGEVVGYEQLSPTLRDLRPDVLIADAGALRDLAQVRELTAAHPDTHLVLFAEDVAAAERAQLLAFGASACLSWKTQARDVRSAVHLASRGMQLTPLSSHLPNGGTEREPLLTPREGDVLVLGDDVAAAHVGCCGELACCCLVGCCDELACCCCCGRCCCSTTRLFCCCCGL